MVVLVYCTSISTIFGPAIIFREYLWNYLVVAAWQPYILAAWQILSTIVTLQCPCKADVLLLDNVNMRAWDMEEEDVQ